MIEYILKYLNEECTTLSSSMMKGNVLDYISDILKIHGLISISSLMPIENYYVFDLYINGDTYIINQNKKTYQFTKGV